MLALQEGLLLLKKKNIYISTEADFEEDRQLSSQNRIAQWSHMTNTFFYRGDLSL